MSDVVVGKEIAVLVSELADEFALGATVAFAEGVEGVDFGEVVSKTFAKTAGIEVFEIFFGV